MSSTPPRRLSPAVYRRRRLMVLLVLLLIIAGVVALFVWQPWRAGADAATSPPASSAPTPPAASATDPATPTPGETTGGETPAASAPAPDPSGTETATAVPPCTTADLTVVAVTDQESYGGDQNPQLSITLTNDGAAACIMNVGTSTQKFEVTSGSDTWWRSTDCQTESSDQVVQIEAGQTVSSATPLQWDRTRSSVDTCDAERPRAAAGWYHLQVSIGGIEAADTRMFQLN